MKLNIINVGFDSEGGNGSQRLPLVIHASSGYRDLAELAEQHRVELDQSLVEHGAILFRGFDIWSAKHFDNVVAALSPRRMEYIYRSTPRTDVGNMIYTATEYPASQEIPLHNENSYQLEWPLKIVLCCLRPARSGGATPIADMRSVGSSASAKILDKFEERGVRYVRHYRPHTDISWQTVFQSTEQENVSRFCATHGIDHEWLDNETLRTIQVCQGTARHPITKERVFFNQAHLFHSSILGREAENALIEQYGRDRLPRQAYYGDGDIIPLSELRIVQDAFASNAIIFSWQPSDLLLIDNMQVAHGRQSYLGKRQVLAALLDPNK